MSPWIYRTGKLNMINERMDCKTNPFIVKHTKEKEKALPSVWNLGPKRKKKTTLENCQFNCAIIERWN